MFLWALSLAAKDASLVDIFWGFGFTIVAGVCLYLAAPLTPYLWLLGSLPFIWGLRLTLYLGKRNLGHGEDKRYVAMRKRAEKKGMSEGAWRLRSLLTIYFGQGLLIMIVSAPVWVGMATGDTYYPEAHPTLAYQPRLTDIGILSSLGAGLWLIGFLFEAIGDAQLASFIKKNKDYKGADEDKPVLDTLVCGGAYGLWLVRPRGGGRAFLRP